MRSLRIFLAMVVLLALAATVSPAWSAPAPAPQQEQDSMTGHDGVSKVEQRRLQHLFWAYNAIWLLLGIYIVSLGVRLRSLHRELARMQRHSQAGASGS